MKLTLKTAEDIERAESMVSWLNRPALENVILALPWLDPQQREHVAKKMKFLFNDCGCLWGGPAFLFIFGYHRLAGIKAAGFSWNRLGFSFLYGIAAGITAKFLSLAWSRQRLKTLIHGLKLPDSGKIQ